MKIKLPTGSTAENNQLLLPEGMLSIDLEKKALRLHDGVTQGGFEMVGSRAFTPPPPGPTTLQFGTADAGYYGAVPSADLITANDLRTLVYPNGQPIKWDYGWLKYSSAGKTIYVAKTPVSTGVSWSQMNTTHGTVFGQKVITIGGRNFKVRLLTGGNADPAGSAGGEFSRLIIPSGNGWGGFNMRAMNIAPAYDIREVCQETSSVDINKCVYRWTEYPNAYSTTSKSGGSSAFGWRPVLELVEN